jgi:mannose-1-phosphate guanylyltransferase
MINLILCGGSGTRLWPLSRTLLPKQFVRLFDGQSLFQQTVRRNEAVSSRFLMVSNAEQFFLAVDQFSEVATAPPSFLLEPVGRNTAPAIALACLMLDAEDLVLVTPSDHLIKDEAAYVQAVAHAKTLAQKGALVTFGIAPTYAETGFGYLEAQGNDVLSFREKPDLGTAESYLAQGNYYWNSGMFCFKAGVLLAELEAHAPEIHAACLAAHQAVADAGAGACKISIPREAMLAIPSESIDYAVMEKSTRVKVVPCAMGWSDMGSFDALYNEGRDPAQANTVVHHGESGQTQAPLCLDAHDNLIVTGKRRIALVDVADLLVVDTADALLISRKGSSQKIKEVVAQLKIQAPALTEIHQMAHRPWGTYEVLLSSGQYKIKRIVVKQGSKLSLQKHFHRNEHWIVVSGTATVTVGDEIFLVRPNESTYIQMGQAHRLENRGRIDLVMIEVQVGEYTGEDDIVRLDDIYDRQEG